MDSDEELFRRTREGDMAAFDGLYERYEVPLFGFLLAVLRSREDAEEMFHEAFLAVLKAGEPHRQGGFAPRTPPRDPARFSAGGFRAWLYRVARNAALNRIRSEQRGARALSQLPAEDPPSTPERDLAERQRHVALETAVARLPPALSHVYHLRTSGLSYEEMADVLEIPVGTLKSRMHEMVTRLREELGPWTAR